ncbi:tRNA pseudouridine(55) synthase TruB [Levilactobacillus bambusae]|uniref:tRNA pseudouridine synthase B n=1 Tax=Levilactobacillus bambusae TaxID=2024736 RepID=A0A2V1N0H8_9LACO|nr:tRNA pseudouridine(55) synthase TruB [Levilactobacillus bambusae]PWG00737.1 tRNA pseudouridine(55) synthase TruB [Levilactobacillus bambusae]
MNGIIPLYKERGMTSHDCVAKMRGILHTKKVGHSGTLDPNVDGVLPICIGAATKVVDYLMASGKRYTGSITLGFSTTTEDLDGEIVERKRLTEPLSETIIDQVLTQMTGDLQQTPPMFSAVKVNGRKLYEYARAGETVDRPTRVIHVESFRRTGTVLFDQNNGTLTFPFEVACSKGTYVRTLAVDVGRYLGVPAVMSDLTRQESGGFTLDDTVTLDEVKEAVADGSLSHLLRPLDYALTDYPHVSVDQRVWRLVQNGVFLSPDELNQTPDEEPFAQVALVHQDQTRCLYQWDDAKGLYRPLKMFNLVDEGEK